MGLQHEEEASLSVEVFFRRSARFDPVSKVELFPGTIVQCTLIKEYNRQAGTILIRYSYISINKYLRIGKKIKIAFQTGCFTGIRRSGKGNIFLVLQTEEKGE